MRKNNMPPHPGVVMIILGALIILGGITLLIMEPPTRKVRVERLPEIPTESQDEYQRRKERVKAELKAEYPNLEWKEGVKLVSEHIKDAVLFDCYLKGCTYGGDIVMSYCRVELDPGGALINLDDSPGSFIMR